jgi:hypothetical protein
MDELGDRPNFWYFPRGMSAGDSLGTGSRGDSKAAVRAAELRHRVRGSLVTVVPQPAIPYQHAGWKAATCGALAGALATAARATRGLEIWGHRPGQGSSGGAPAPPARLGSLAPVSRRSRPHALRRPRRCRLARGRLRAAMAVSPMAQVFRHRGRNRRACSSSPSSSGRSWCSPNGRRGARASARSAHAQRRGSGALALVGTCRGRRPDADRCRAARGRRAGAPRRSRRRLAGARPASGHRAFPTQCGWRSEFWRAPRGWARSRALALASAWVSAASGLPALHRAETSTRRGGICSRRGSARRSNRTRRLRHKTGSQNRRASTDDQPRGETI